MTQDHATPVPPRAPMVVRAGTEAGPAAVPPVPDAGTGPGTEPVLVPVVPVPMSVPERTRRAVSRWLSTAVANPARELWLPIGRLVRSLLNGRPESMTDHYRYMTSCAWVPKELGGKKATAVAVAGLAYHILVAWPLLAFSNALGGAAPRPLRLLCVAVPVLILVLLFVI